MKNPFTSYRVTIVVIGVDEKGEQHGEAKITMTEPRDVVLNEGYPKSVRDLALTLERGFE